MIERIIWQQDQKHLYHNKCGQSIRYTCKHLKKKVDQEARMALGNHNNDYFKGCEIKFRVSNRPKLNQETS